jgi:phage shock protein PspC (stress-responsive transcriptional regulator)
MTTTAHTPTGHTPTSGTPTGQTPTRLDRFFDTLHRRTIVRSADGKIAGICAAVADRLGVSVKLVRLAAIVLALVGPGLGAYLAVWLVTPDTRGRLPLERAVRGGEGKAIALLIVTVLVVIADADVHVRLGGFALAALAIAVFGFGVGRGGAAGGHHRPTAAPGAMTSTPMPYADTPPTQSAPLGGCAPYPGQHTAYGPQDAPRW